MASKKFGTLTGGAKVFLVTLIIWIALQISRLIALTLIDSINAGGDSVAWLYPAYLDLFAAVFAIPIMWAIWKYRGFLTWTTTVMYLVISIIDHCGNFLTTTFVAPPSIAEDMNPYLIPAIQTALDLLFVILLLLPRFRNLFFRIKEPTTEQVN